MTLARTVNDPAWTATHFVAPKCACGAMCSITSFYEPMSKSHRVHVWCDHGRAGYPRWEAAVEYDERVVAMSTSPIRVAGTLGTPQEYAAGSSTPTIGSRNAPGLAPGFGKRTASAFDGVDRGVEKIAKAIRADDEFRWNVAGWNRGGDAGDWWVAIAVDVDHALDEVRVTARRLRDDHYRTGVVKGGVVATLRSAPHTESQADAPPRAIDPQYAPRRPKIGDDIAVNSDGTVRAATSRDDERGSVIGTMIGEYGDGEIMVTCGDTGVVMRMNVDRPDDLSGPYCWGDRVEIYLDNSDHTWVGTIEVAPSHPLQQGRHSWGPIVDGEWLYWCRPVDGRAARWVARSAIVGFI